MSERNDDYRNGYADGLRRAASMLRDEAEAHIQDAKTDRTVLGDASKQFAARILLSWANGFDIEADMSTNRKG